MYRDENWAQNKFSPVGPHYLCLQLFLVTLNFLTHVSLLHFQLYGKKQTNTIRLSNECFNVASCVNSLLSSHSFFFILDTCLQSRYCFLSVPLVLHHTLLRQLNPQTSNFTWFYYSLYLFIVSIRFVGSAKC